MWRFMSARLMPLEEINGKYIWSNGILNIENVDMSSKIDENDIRKVCAFCKKNVDIRYRCSACRLVKYCGVECQKKAWEKGHKNVCKKLLLVSRNLK